MSHKRIVIFGANSAMAEACAIKWADPHTHFYLVGRNEAHLNSVSKNLSARASSRVMIKVEDLDKIERHESLVREAAGVLGGFDRVLLAYGTLGDQDQFNRDTSAALANIATNFVSPVSLLLEIAKQIEAQNFSTEVVVIGSVAGDRGRPSNFIYGSAKGGLALFLQGLRARLFKTGSLVLTVKPGFVDTPMTAKFRKGLLWAKPEKIAKVIDCALRRRVDVVYAPKFWRIILFVIRIIPECIFKRLKL
jgi:short-subunit dehydrogenase